MAVSARIFLAGLFHETNTFTGTSTSLEDFRVARGAELFAARGNASPMDGFLSAAEGYGWRVVPGVDYRAQPSGMPADAVFETYWSELCPRLEVALRDGLEAIFLVLHGAMATPSIADVEGELLERVRALPGAAHLPIFAVLDLHANVSERMAQNASALIPYRENPHTDARETAVRAAGLLWRALTSGRTPRTHYLHGRILLAPPSAGTASAPMRDLEGAARCLENSAGHWEVGVAAGFAHADTPDTGVSFWVVSDLPKITCHRTLESLSALARLVSRDARPGEWELSAALDRIAEEKKFPALLVEPADNIGGGAPGDARFILRALLNRPLGRCGVVLNDPGAVASLRNRAGQSAKILLGKPDSAFDPEPLELEVTVDRISDGSFELEDGRVMEHSLGSMVD